MRVTFSNYQRIQSRAINVVIETSFFDPLTNRIRNSINQKRKKISCGNRSECDCGFDFDLCCLSQHEDVG